MKTLFGIGVTNAIAIGTARIIEREAFSTAESSSDVNTEHEITRIHAALEKSRAQILEIIETTDQLNVDIIKTQLDLLDDPSFNKEPIYLIQNHKISAEEAINQITDELYQTFQGFDDDPYIKERATDIKDIGHRILANLTGKDIGFTNLLRENSIVIAYDLVPSQTAQLDRSKIRGLITQVGGTTSHTSIMAKAMGIAAVVGCFDILKHVKNGDTVIVDSKKGEVIISPEEDDYKKYLELKKEYESDLEAVEKFNHIKLQRQDGSPVYVAANIGNTAEAITAKKNGADGIGLFRTEFLFMNRSSLPSEEEQFAAYKEVAEIFADAPVIIRTLDIGGDKDLSYLALPHEDNPYLGVRAIRLCLKYKDMFKEQLCAILRASAFGNLKIMFPMISCLDELNEAKELLNACEYTLDQRGVSYNKSIEVGIMVEIPAVAMAADEFTKSVDFFSIGTNDLTQYALAVDRGNPALSALFSYFHPGVLRLIENTISAAHKAGIPCYMCGEMASDKKAIALLSDYGLDEFSVSIDAIGRVKKIIASQKDIRIQ